MIRFILNIPEVLISLVNMRNRLYIRIFLIFVLVISFSISELFAQGVDELERQLKSRSKELQRIREEIEDFNRRIKASRKKEQSMLEQLQQLEEEISLITRLVQELTREEDLKKQEIQRLQREITVRSSSLEQLKRDFAERLIHIYKQGPYSEWELLLTSNSLNEALYRYKYLRVLSAYNLKTAREIRQQIGLISEKQRRLSRELERVKKIIQEKDSERARLSQKRSERKQMLARVRRDRKSLEENLKQRQKAAREIEILIASLEKEKKKRQEELARLREQEGLKVSGRFMASKGKLPWPVKGKIVSRFGTQKHPILKTITENTGIDIKAPEGAEVKVVMDGVVSAITWIRGFGNTIIVDHGDGFYTVYTHVESVMVETNQYVSAGEVIARVGDSGSLDGAKLHFEIWGGKQKLNPEYWLARL